MWIVRFEMVSAVEHPEYYQDEAPIVSRAAVPGGHWKAIAVTHQAQDNAVEQFQGLKDLIRLGELIRNVKIRMVLDLDPIDSQTYSGGEDQEGQPKHAGRQAPEGRPDDR